MAETAQNPSENTDNAEQQPSEEAMALSGGMLGTINAGQRILEIAANIPLVGIPIRLFQQVANHTDIDEEVNQKVQEKLEEAKGPLAERLEPLVKLPPVKWAFEKVEQFQQWQSGVAANAGNWVRDKLGLETEGAESGEGNDKGEEQQQETSQTATQPEQTQEQRAREQAQQETASVNTPVAGGDDTTEPDAPGQQVSREPTNQRVVG